MEQFQIIQQLQASNKRSRRSDEVIQQQEGGGGGRRRRRTEVELLNELSTGEVEGEGRILRSRSMKDKEGVGRDIPIGYEILAGGNLLTAWIRYFVGQGSLKPGKDLSGRGLSRKLASNLSKYKTLMKAIIEQAKKEKKNGID